MNRSEFIEQFAHWFDPEQIRQLARQTRWLLRQGKICAFEFVVGLVFGQMSALRLSLRAQASTFTEPVSRQAVDQRYHERTVEFFHAVFERVFQLSLPQNRPALTAAFAQQFAAVQVVDSTSFDCPDSLAKIYPGCGGVASAANCKVLLRYEYLRSQFEPVALLPGKRSDQGLADRLPALVKANELLLVDKGFFKVSVLRQIQERNAFFLLPWIRCLSLRVAQPDGSLQTLDLASALQHTAEPVREWSTVWVGGQDALAVRLVAFRLSAESAGRHRAALREAQRKQGRTPTAQALELAGWLILITNIPADKVPAAALSYLYRLRWQIELVFKQCKSVLRLNVTEADSDEHRIQCEIWGRLIAAVVLFAWHSHLQAAGPRGCRGEVSFAQLAGQFQQQGLTLAYLLIQGGQRLRDYLGNLLRQLLHTTRKGRQRTRKTTWQNLEEHWLHPAPN